MKVDFSQPLLDLAGKPLQAQADGALKPLTLGLACCEALLAANGEGDAVTKVRQFKLALLAYEGGEREVSPEDAALLRERIAAVYAPLVVGRAYELLNG